MSLALLIALLLHAGLWALRLAFLPRLVTFFPGLLVCAVLLVAASFLPEIGALQREYWLRTEADVLRLWIWCEALVMGLWGFALARETDAVPAWPPAPKQPQVLPFARVLGALPGAAFLLLVLLNAHAVLLQEGLRASSLACVGVPLLVLILVAVLSELFRLRPKTFAVDWLIAWHTLAVLLALLACLLALATPEAHFRAADLALPPATPQSLGVWLAVLLCAVLPGAFSPAFKAPPQTPWPAVVRAPLSPSPRESRSSP